MYKICKNDVKEYIKTRDTVSVPELQAVFSLGYRAAKALLSELQENRFVSQKCEKIKYAVNRRQLGLTVLSDELCEQLAEKVSDESISTLARIRRTPREVRDSDKATDELLALDFIYEFEGRYYCGISWDSLYLLRMAKRRLRARLAAEERKRRGEETAADSLRSLFQNKGELDLDDLYDDGDDGDD